MDTRWKKHNREAEQEDVGGGRGKAWSVVGNLAGCMSLVVLCGMGICQSIIWAGCGCEEGYGCKHSVEQLKLQREFGKLQGKKFFPKRFPVETSHIMKFSTEILYEILAHPAAPAVLFQPIFWGLTSNGTVNQTSLSICITETVGKINGWGLNWEGKVDNGSVLLWCLLIISQAPLAPIKENKRI